MLEKKKETEEVGTRKRRKKKRKINHIHYPFPVLCESYTTDCCLLTI